MRLRKSRLVWVVSLAAILASRPSYSAESDSPEAKEDPCKVELAKLAEEYRRASREWYASLPVNDATEYTDSELTDEEWLNQDPGWVNPALEPETRFIPQFRALAEKYPDSPYALDALAYAIYRGGPQTGNVRGEAWRTKERAIDVVEKKYMDDPRIVHVLDILGGGIPSEKNEAFLRNTFMQSPDRATRAAAGLSLARYLQSFGKIHKRSQWLQNKPRLLGYERFWKTVITPYVLENFPYDQEKGTAEIEQLLTTQVEEYSDVPAMDWTFGGPSRVFLETMPYANPKTYGDLASALLYELSHLAPGKQAPDIAGKDADGNEFRLSDYEGKVVLLTFSADWCGGCVKLYPMQRRLIEKYKDEPFVILSVSRDETIDTLKASIASGDITWRCWWDGMDGPIREAWNSPGAPHITLLDHNRVIQDLMLQRNAPQEEFESAIDQVVSRASASGVE